VKMSVFWNCWLGRTDSDSEDEAPPKQKQKGKNRSKTFVEAEKDTEDNVTITVTEENHDHVPPPTVPHHKEVPKENESDDAFGEDSSDDDEQVHRAARQDETPKQVRLQQDLMIPNAISRVKSSLRPKYPTAEEEKSPKSDGSKDSPQLGSEKSAFSLVHGVQVVSGTEDAAVLAFDGAVEKKKVPPMLKKQLSMGDMHSKRCSDPHIATQSPKEDGKLVIKSASRLPHTENAYSLCDICGAVQNRMEACPYCNAVRACRMMIGYTPTFEIRPEDFTPNRIVNFYFLDFVPQARTGSAASLCVREVVYPEGMASGKKRVSGVIMHDLLRPDIDYFMSLEHGPKNGKTYQQPVYLLKQDNTTIFVRDIKFTGASSSITSVAKSSGGAKRVASPSTGMDSIVEAAC
jgi:hypothetical protein